MMIVKTNHTNRAFYLSPLSVTLFSFHSLDEVILSLLLPNNVIFLCDGVGCHENALSVVRARKKT